MQDIVVSILFGLAIAYIGFMFYKSYYKKGVSCNKGCGCETSEIKNQIQLKK